MKMFHVFFLFCFMTGTVFASGQGEIQSEAGTSSSIVIVDDRGKDVILEKPGENVAVFPMPLAEAAIAISRGTDRIAGINPAAKDVIMEGVLAKYIPSVADIDTSFINRDFLPNVEELLVADPDVIIQWNMGQDKYYAPMETLGKNVICVGWGTPEKEAARMTILGQVFGEEERAEQFLDWRDDVAAAIAEEIRSVPQEERTTMLFFDGFKDGKLAVFGRMNTYFQASGLRNLATENGADSGSVLIDIEQVAAWNPEVIFINYYNYNDNVGHDFFLNHPALQDVDAVKSRRIYETPRIDPGSHMQPVVCEWFASLAYPDRFAGMDIREKVRESYDFAYGISLEDEDIDTLLQISVNGSSALYPERMMK